MKGDFSKYEFYPENADIDFRTNNFTGVMHQQGRGLLDQDWNAADQIIRHLRQTQNRDIIGSNVVAVPSDLSNSFKVIKAIKAGDEFTIELYPGRVYLDGLHLAKSGGNSSMRSVEYFKAPVQHPPADPNDIANGSIVKDAVVLEVWEEAISAFQDTDHLLEKALGGVDTTERVKIAHNIKLLRIGSDEECHNIKDRLKDDFDKKGKLTVTPADTISISGLCPVELSGGYSGFEHYLYRIEIAEATAGGDSQFKWSRFNGGLVGRGTYDDTSDKVSITANDQMINHCGLNSFYLEALQEDIDGGSWIVVFSADATIVENGTLSLSNIGASSTWPAGMDGFFRLWDGHGLVEDYSAALAKPKELEEELGILVQFEVPDILNASYKPGDYWSFPVRAAGIGVDTSQWPNDDPPYGVRYYRAPIAIINWPQSPPAEAVAPESISDCRKVIQPLADFDTCCTVTVGDGVYSTGDFATIQEAINSLPARGGVVCVLSGVHNANVLIENKENIVVRGCGKMTKVAPQVGTSGLPLFNIKNSKCIVLEHMDVLASDRNAFLLEGSSLGKLSDITIQHNRILACDQAIHISNGINITIARNKIRMLDKEKSDVAIYMLAEDSLIERNDITVIPAGATPPIDDPGGGPGVNPIDECLEIEVLILRPTFLLVYWSKIWNLSLNYLASQPYLAQGGIQIAGTSERITVFRNRIQGGTGNGITLGNYFYINDNGSTGTGGGEEEKKYTVLSTFGIRGRVVDEQGVALDNISVSVISETGATTATTSHDGGNFFFDVESGRYQIVENETDYEIADLDSFSLGSGKLYTLILQTAETTEEDDIFGFIYDVDIEDNEILDMGLNGIGGPQLENIVNNPGLVGPAAVLDRNNLMVSAKHRNSLGVRNIMGIFISSIVVGLRIRKNYIHNCLNSPFNADMLRQARSIGFGGIALAWCEQAIIEHNRIEENGRSHIDPVCGITSRGSQITVRENHIINNGPIMNPSSEASVLSGIRGGIVLLALSAPITGYLSSFLKIEGEQAVGVTASDSLNATTIHNNIVQQPAGPALLLFSLGSTAITDNQFSSEISAKSMAEKMGSLGVVNVLHISIAGMSGLSKRKQPPLASAGTFAFTKIRAGSSLLFNDNQSRLGVAQACLASQFIISNGDVGFSDNQCIVNIYDDKLAFNTALIGKTVRAVDSRFIERLPRTVQAIGDVNRLKNNAVIITHNAYLAVSKTEGQAVTPNLLTLKPLSLSTLTTAMNNTSNNQGDHCILAVPFPSTPVPVPTVANGNQVANSALCLRFMKILEAFSTNITSRVLDLLE